MLACSVSGEGVESEPRVTVDVLNGIGVDEEPDPADIYPGDCDAPRSLGVPTTFVSSLECVVGEDDVQVLISCMRNIIL